MDHLIDCIVDIPALLALIDEISSKVSSSAGSLTLLSQVVSMSRNISHKLSSWKQSWMNTDESIVSEIPAPAEFDPILRITDSSTGELVRPNVFMLRDSLCFQAWCHYHAALLIVSRVKLRFSIKEDVNAGAGSRNVLEIAHLFCRAMHYFLIYTLPSIADRIIQPFKVVYNLLPEHGPERGFMDRVYTKKIQGGLDMRLNT